MIIDHDAANVEVLRRFGFEVFYGDITRLDLLESAGASEAELLVIAIRDVEKAKKLVELVRKHYPKLTIVANAADRSATYELMDLGVKRIRRETFGSALDMGQDALVELGMDPYEAYRKKRLFRRMDELSLPELYRLHREDEEKYVSVYQKQSDDLEELMKLDQEARGVGVDEAWKAANPEK